MADVSGQIGNDAHRPPRSGLAHPLTAGGLAVGLVALLAVCARSLTVAGWDEAPGAWLAAGAVLLVAAGWIASVRARRQGGSTPRQPAAGPAPRGVRRHRRYVPRNRATILHLQDGRRVAARIANISVAAVAVEARLTDADYPAVLRVGSRDVGPIRRTPTGAVFGFAHFLEPQPFDGSFVL